MLIVGFGYADLIFHSRCSMFIDKDCLVVWCRPAGRQSNTLYGYGAERIWSSVECAVAGKGVQEQCEPEAMSNPTQVMLAGKAHPADQAGQALIQEWIHFIRQPEVRP